MHKGFLRAGAILAALAVALGAFGAHGLKAYVPAETINTFETGVKYQFYHALALLVAGIVAEKFPVRWVRYAGNSFIGGIVLFSGSLYVLTFLKATETVGLSGIGAITPFGGLLFILGWLFLLYSFYVKK